MTRRRARRVQALPDHLTRIEAWSGLHPGDPVDIAGPAPTRATWRFRAFVRNERNGAESVEVVGGRPGEQHVRSFRPDQVFSLGGRKRGHLSLAEAPQLPWGETVS
jgi:hypothetical protein